MAPFIIAIINLLACITYESITTIEAPITKNAQTVSTFNKIFMMQYTNIAILILLINFNSETTISATETAGEVSKYVPFFRGNYKDFTSEWYADIGASICFTIVIKILSPHLTK